MAHLQFIIPKQFLNSEYLIFFQLNEKSATIQKTKVKFTLQNDDKIIL